MFPLCWFGKMTRIHIFEKQAKKNQLIPVGNLYLFWQGSLMIIHEHNGDTKMPNDTPISNQIFNGFKGVLVAHQIFRLDATELGTIS